MIQVRYDLHRWECDASRTKSILVRSLNVLSSFRAFAAAGSASLIAMALLLAPAVAQTTQHNKASRSGTALNARPVGAFTPAVSDPRLAAALARRGTRFT